MLNVAQKSIHRNSAEIILFTLPDDRIGHFGNQIIVDIWFIFSRTDESPHFDIGWKRYDRNSDCCAETLWTWSWIFSPCISSILSFFYSTSLITLNVPKAFDWSSLLQNLYFRITTLNFSSCRGSIPFSAWTLLSP